MAPGSVTPTFSELEDFGAA